MSTSATLIAEPAATAAPASVPIIDIGGFADGSPEAQQAIVDAIDAACRSIGFFVITGHGVDPAAIERVSRATRAFFDLPAEQKAQYNSAYMGYFGAGRQTVAKSMDDVSTPPDTHEIFGLGREMGASDDPYFTSPEGQRAFPNNVWPTVLPEFRAAWLPYFDEMERLAKTLMAIFERALELPEGWFRQRFNQHMSRVAAINYPASDVDPLPNQQRLGAHTDFGAFTLLKAESKPGSLEVRAKNGVWEPVPILPDAYIINIGDMLKRWTNDVWESSLHRVGNPPRAEAGNSRRQSLVYFFHPNHDAVIEPLPGFGTASAKYPPISAGELLTSRVEKTRSNGKTSGY